VSTVRTPGSAIAGDGSISAIRPRAIVLWTANA
jgi:hypothetical protein